MEKNEEMKLELERKIRMRDNLIREQELFSKQIPELETRMSIHSEGVELLRANQKIILDNFKLEKLTWSYENDPVYLDNLKKLNMLNFKKAELDWKNQTEQMKSSLDSAKEQVVKSQEMLTKVTEEIAKLEGDLNGE